MDLNHDAISEFLGGHMSSGTYWVFESGANNTFTLDSELLEAEPPAFQFVASDVGDADSDGLMELAGRGEIGNDIFFRVYESLTPNRYPSKLMWELQVNSFQRGIKIADTDGDGAREFVLGGGDNGLIRVEIHESLGNDTFVQTLYHAFPSALLNSPQGMIVADDLDGDGAPEILMSGIGGGSRVVALESTGNDTYVQSWSFDLPYRDGQLVNATVLVDAGDLDGDGKKELLVGGPSTITLPGQQFYSVLYVLEAQADDTFAVVATLEKPMGLGNSTGAVADVDGDGRREIVLGADDAGGLTIFRNVGDDTWEDIWWSGPLLSPYTYLGAGDHDKDGKDEIVLPQNLYGRIEIYEIDPADAADADADGVVDAIDNCPATLNPAQEDADADGVGDFCDNCLHGPNPDQGPAPFGQAVLAVGTDFSWSIPAEVVYVRGGLSTLGSYAIDQQVSLPLALGFTDGVLPAAGSGFYYLVRPDCPLGSWQTTPGAEPQRDVLLP